MLTLSGYDRRMGTIISFEERAVAALRERLGAAEQTNNDLLAFAQGHSGAVAAIHGAVLAAIEAPSLDAMFRTVTNDWPALLGLDSVSLVLVVGKDGFCADATGVSRVESRLIEQAGLEVDGVLMRNVGRGHPLFGQSANIVRSEALIRIDNASPLPRGLLLLGQASEQPVDSPHGAMLLMFLGETLSAMIRRWLIAN